MPDIANREKKEAALAALLRRAFGRTRSRIMSALGTPPDVENVPESLWEELTADVEADLRRAIAIALLRGVRGMNLEFGESTGFTVNPKDAAVTAERFATTRARQSARALVSTYRDRIATATGVAAEKIDRRIEEARRNGIDESSRKWPSFEDVERELEADIRETASNQAEAAGVTETTTAHSAGEISYRDGLKKDKEIILVARWNIDVRSNVCPICWGLNGSFEPQWPDKYRDGPPAHPQCILPGNLVVPFGKLTAASKSFYVGDCIEASLENGARFSITKNHPVLTERGWVPAHALNLRDKVVYAASPERIAAALTPNNSNVPTRIEEVFGSLVKSRQVTTNSMPVSAEDFHGDGVFLKGKIDIVNASSPLTTKSNTGILEHFREPFLRSRFIEDLALFGGRNLEFRFAGDNAALAGSMGREEHPPSLRYVRAFPPKLHSVRAGSQLNIGFGEYCPNCSTPYAANFRKSPHARSGLRQFGNLGPTQARFEQGVFDLGAKFQETESFHRRVNAGHALADFSAQFLERFAGQISLVKVANLLAVEGFSGHVYDLQCPEYELYSCNGIIVHNCACFLTWEPIP